MAVVEVHPEPMYGPWIEEFVLDPYVLSKAQFAESASTCSLGSKTVWQGGTRLPRYTGARGCVAQKGPHWNDCRHHRPAQFEENVPNGIDVPASIGGQREGGAID